MRPPSTVRRRLLGVFSGFALLLCCLMALLILAAYYRGQDRFVRRQLEQALAGGPTVVDEAALGRVLVGDWEEVPVGVARQMGEPLPGHHEVDEEGAEAHLLVAVDPRTGRTRFALLRVAESEAFELALELGLVGAVILVTGAAWWLAWSLARRIVAPIEALDSNLAGRGGSDLTPPKVPVGADAEVRRLAATLGELMSRVEAAGRRERRFIQEASHELRTPITVVRGACDLLREDGAGDEERFTARVERIGRAVARMELTVQSLLWLAREENRITADSPPFAEQLAERVAELRALAEAGVDLEVQVGPLALGQPAESMLAIALTNLLRNALEHTETGRVSLRVDASEAVVRDTGRGMEETTLAAANDPWRAIPSPGLGLPLVHRICSRFGWSVTLVRRPTGGTEARIRLV